MRIERVILHHIKMPLKSPFQTSFGTQADRDIIIVEAHTKDLVGYAEVTAMYAPLYNEESTGTAWHIVKDFLVPMILGKELAHPSEVSQLFAPVRGNNMAKSGVESAVWDLWAREQGISLSRALGGTKDRIEVGVSVGIQESIDDLLRVVGGYLEDGYRKIKVKIKPGKDSASIKALRQEFGDIPLMADANSAYSLRDIDLFKEMDEFGLMMIEQPLGHDDLVQHSKLQAHLKTPICLDESIHTLENAAVAIELGSCRVINIKVGRVGGLANVKRIHDLCAEHNIPVWCGGMLESGVGRAHNIALTTLPNFTLPGDTSASSRYWEMDIVEPEITMTSDGYIEVPTKPGMGFEVVDAKMKKYLVRSEVVAR